jgi:hypothetical protein
VRHSNSKCAGWRQKRIKQKFCGEKKKKWHARQLAVVAEIDSRKWHQQYYRFALLLGC